MVDSPSLSPFVLEVWERLTQANPFLVQYSKGEKGLSQCRRILLYLRHIGMLRAIRPMAIVQLRLRTDKYKVKAVRYELLTRPVYSPFYCVAGKIGKTWWAQVTQTGI